MSIIFYYFSYLSNLYFGYPLIVRIAVFFVYILIIGYLFAVLRMYMLVRKATKAAERKKSIKDRFEKKLQNILSAPNDLSNEGIENILGVQEQQLKNWEKRYLTDLILTLKSSLKVFNNHNFKHLIKILDFVKFWEEDMKEDDFSKNRKALDVLDEFDESVTGSTFSRKINSSDNDLRKLMKTEYLRFATNDAFSFLEGGFDRSFNNLDALRIHDALKERAKVKPIRMVMPWVQTSKNEDYQCFLINEVAFFKQLESAPHLMALYKTTSNKVKSSIAKTLGTLKYEDAIPILSHDYNFTTNQVQFSIISALGKIGTNDAYMALEKIYLKTYDDEMLLKIVENMYKIDSERTERVVRGRENVSEIEKAMLGSMHHELLYA